VGARHISVYCKQLNSGQRGATYKITCETMFMSLCSPTQQKCKLHLRENHSNAMHLPSSMINEKLQISLVKGHHLQYQLSPDSGNHVGCLHAPV